MQNFQNNSFLSEFNDAQREAVLYCDGPSLVVAGAGSGKTRVLTYKIAYLISQGYKPWNILALTFTNKAANEMKQRIGRIVGDDLARNIWMGTFHSVFLRILKAEHELLGFSADFTIYDASDSKSLIKSIIKEMGLDDKLYKASTIAAIISNAKNQLQTAEDYYDSPADYQADVRSKRPHTRDIFRRYADRCRQADAMDFDDILLYTYRLLSQRPEVCQKYEERFHYVLVDEYQDTNFAQHRIVWLLSQHRKMVCVVGDDAQSIYSFRGARIDNILKFQQMYEGARIFKLEQNYRSTQTIVLAANSLIHKNRWQIEKNVFSKGSVGEPLQLSEVASDNVEAERVVNNLYRLHRNEGISYAEMAVLYRTNAQSRVFEEALRKVNIPYRVYGGVSFYQRKEIKDVLAYFRLAVNPKDEEALKRVINYPARGIGATTVQKIVACATEAAVSLWEVICNPAQYSLALSPSLGVRLVEFREKIQSFSHAAATSDAFSTGEFIIRESGIYDDIHQENTPEFVSRQENVDELTNGMRDFCDSRLEEGNEHVSLSDYLAEVSLISDIDTDRGDDNEKVSLMTIHSAKGLEFDTVFIVGIEEELLPNQMAIGSPREVEEERRLFYVAITRAKNHCYLSCAKQRYRFGHLDFCKPSRFLSDIDPQYIARKSGSAGSGIQTTAAMRRFGIFGPHSFRPTTTTSSRTPEVPKSRVADISKSTTSTASDSGDIRPGVRVLHDRFGAGIVVSVERSADSHKATVNFDDVGVKQLLLKYAKLKIINS